MNQEQKEVIIKSVNEIGLTDTLTIFGGNEDIIRKAYILVIKINLRRKNRPSVALRKKIKTF